MTILDERRTGTADAPGDEQPIDLTDQPARHEADPDGHGHDGGDDHDPRPHHEPHPRIDPSGRITYRGMRIRRVRLDSVAKISFVFWLLAYGVVLGTAVVVWNVARAFGFVASFEETMITSLGLESFEVDGSGLFGLLAAGVGLLCLLGWLATIALAAVYNATCGAVGGLAVETGPLHRRRRVFSWRHRGFVTVTE